MAVLLGPRRLVACSALVASLAVALVAPATPSRADDGTQRVQAAQAALQDSSAAVQAAGAVLARTSALLPAARTAVDQAQGELVGARARAQAAQEQVQRGRLALGGATNDVDRASAAVDHSRATLGQLARRSYELGPLQDVRSLTDSGPGQVLARVGMLQQVFRGTDDMLRQLCEDRYALAGRRGRLTAAQAELDGLSADATRREDHAQAVAARAQQAQDHVANLVAEQGRALVQAEAARSADAAEYQQAQVASARLKAQIRAAATAARRRAEAARVLAAARARAAARAAAEARALAEARAAAASRAAAKARAATEARAAAQARAYANVRAGAAARALADARAQADAQASAAATAAANTAANAAANAAAEAGARAAAQASQSAATTVVHQVGRFLWPASGPLTSTFGWRMHPIFHVMRFHAGIDIGASYGAPVSAAADGVVTSAGDASGYGTLVVISHGTRGGQDLSTAYAHMSQLLVSVGQHVGRGQQVGAVGNEGNSTGPHLHFEVRLDGSPVDPLGYVSQP